MSIVRTDLPYFARYSRNLEGGLHPQSQRNKVLLLKRFLLEFKGDDFAKEFAPYRETLETAESNFEAKLEETVTKIEEMLTPKQNEALLHYIFQKYVKEFLISNLELLSELIACKLDPEPCLLTKSVEGR